MKNCFMGEGQASSRAGKDVHAKQERTSDQDNRLVMHYYAVFVMSVSGCPKEFDI